MEEEADEKFTCLRAIKLLGRKDGVTPKGEVRNGLLVGCQSFCHKARRAGCIVRESEVDGEGYRRRAVRGRCTEWSLGGPSGSR